MNTAHGEGAGTPKLGVRAAGQDARKIGIVDNENQSRDGDAGPVRQHDLVLKEAPWHRGRSLTRLQ
jgi:hypothetical protein